MFSSPDRRPPPGRIVFSAACCALLLWLASCARHSATAVERLAVLRLENVGGDSATDWMGRALSEAIIAGLAGDPDLYAMPSLRLHTLGPALGVRPVAAPGISAEAPLALAAGASRLAYGEFFVARGVLHVRLNIENPRSHKIVQALEPVTSRASDVAAAATALARQIWPRAEPYPARNPAALEAYAKALEAADVRGIDGAARQAIADDPDFGAPYLLLADLLAQCQDSAGVTQILQAAAARGAALPQADRASLEVLAAGLGGDSAARGQALALLARLHPSDPGAWRGLAESADAREQHTQAMQAYEKALQIEPEDVKTWNQLAYSAASAGNLPVAMAALRRYQSIRPTDPNPLDSMGDVNLMLGHLKEAGEFYLAAVKASPGFYEGGDYYKAAVARLMAGDVAGADALYDRYPGAARHRADWLWTSGRRRQAYQALLAQAPGLPAGDPQSHAYAVLAIWSCFLGDRAAAQHLARQAAASAGPGAAPLAALAVFLATPPLSPDEWTARARQYFPSPTGPPGASKAQDAALACALLLDEKFAAAAAVLGRIDNGSAAPDNSTAIELGWALLESGKTAEAAPFLRLNPLPSITGPGPLAGFYFPCIFRLRAELAGKQGKAEEARSNQRIFEALSER